MNTYIVENKQGKEEIFKVAVYLLLQDELDRELTSDENESLNRLFFKLGICPEYKTSEELIQVKRDELIAIKNKICEICSPESEIYPDLLNENVFKPLYEVLKDTSDSAKNTFLFELYYCALLYDDMDARQERFIGYIAEKLNIPEELYLDFADTINEVGEQLYEVKRKGGIV